MSNMSSDSDPEISKSDKSTTEVSTSGVSLMTDRSKSPFVNFQDDQVSPSVSESGISVTDKSTTEVSTSGVSLKTDRSKSPFVNFKDDQVSPSSVSESGISVTDKSTTEDSTSGVSLKTDRSKSPFVNFKDNQVSTRERILEWLDQMETQSSEVLDTAEESLEPISSSYENELSMLLHRIGDELDTNEELCKMINMMDNAHEKQRFVRTLSLLGAAGVIALMAFLRS